MAAIIIGFALAVAIGIPAATLMIYSAWFRRSVYPILLTAQVLPKVALAPLFIVWFGFGLLPKVLMTFLISFFPIVIDTLTGLNAVRPESLLLIRSMGGTRWQAFARGNLDTLTVFAAILWLIAIGFLFYFAVELAERLVVRGRGAHRSRELGAGL